MNIKNFCRSINDLYRVEIMSLGINCYRFHSRPIRKKDLSRDLTLVIMAGSRHIVHNCGFSRHQYLHYYLPLEIITFIFKLNMKFADGVLPDFMQTECDLLKAIEEVTFLYPKKVKSPEKAKNINTNQ